MLGTDSNIYNLNLFIVAATFHFFGIRRQIYDKKLKNKNKMWARFFFFANLFGDNYLQLFAR
jgi:hypothetical protein